MDEDGFNEPIVEASTFNNENNNDDNNDNSHEEDNTLILNILKTIVIPPLRSQFYENLGLLISRETQRFQKKFFFLSQSFSIISILLNAFYEISMKINKYFINNSLIMCFINSTTINNRINYICQDIKIYNFLVRPNSFDYDNSINTSFYNSNYICEYNNNGNYPRPYRKKSKVNTSSDLSFMSDYIQVAPLNSKSKQDLHRTNSLSTDNFQKNLNDTKSKSKIHKLSSSIEYKRKSNKFKNKNLKVIIINYNSKKKILKTHNTLDNLDKIILPLNDGDDDDEKLLETIKNINNSIDKIINKLDDKCIKRCCLYCQTYHDNLLFHLKIKNPDGSTSSLYKSKISITKKNNNNNNNNNNFKKISMVKSSCDLHLHSSSFEKKNTEENERCENSIYFSDVKKNVNYFEKISHPYDTTPEKSWMKSNLIKNNERKISEFESNYKKNNETVPSTFKDFNFELSANDKYTNEFNPSHNEQFNKAKEIIKEKLESNSSDSSNGINKSLPKSSKSYTIIPNKNKNTNETQENNCDIVILKKSIATQISIDSKNVATKTDLNDTDNTSAKHPETLKVVFEKEDKKQSFIFADKNREQLLNKISLNIDFFSNEMMGFSLLMIPENSPGKLGAQNLLTQPATNCSLQVLQNNVDTLNKFSRINKSKLDENLENSNEINKSCVDNQIDNPKNEIVKTNNENKSNKMNNNFQKKYESHKSNSINENENYIKSSSVKSNVLEMKSELMKDKKSVASQWTDEHENISDTTLDKFLKSDNINEMNTYNKIRKSVSDVEATCGSSKNLSIENISLNNLFIKCECKMKSKPIYYKKHRKLYQLKSESSLSQRKIHHKKIIKKNRKRCYFISFIKSCSKKSSRFIKNFIRTKIIKPVEKSDRESRNFPDLNKYLYRQSIVNDSLIDSPYKVYDNNSNKLKTNNSSSSELHSLNNYKNSYKNYHHNASLNKRQSSYYNFNYLERERGGGKEDAKSNKLINKRINYQSLKFLLKCFDNDELKRNINDTYDNNKSLESLLEKLASNYHYFSDSEIRCMINLFKNNLTSNDTILPKSNIYQKDIFNLCRIYYNHNQYDLQNIDYNLQFKLNQYTNLCKNVRNLLLQNSLFHDFNKIIN